MNCSIYMSQHIFQPNSLVNISKQFRRGSLIMIESTVGPGTVEGIIVPLLEIGSGKDFGVASCPERADPGKIMKYMVNVPRIIGGVDGSMAART